MSWVAYTATALIILYLIIGALFVIAVSLTYGPTNLKIAIRLLLTWPRAFFL